MLAYANKRKINIILCEKIDRLTRNMKDAVLISEWLEENDEREVHFIKENFIVNKNTKAHENLVWDMKVAIARFYTKNLSEEVRKGQKEKLAQGGYPSQAKLGYKTVGEKGRKTHVKDEPRASFVREIFELYSTGNYSVKALVEMMYKKGLRNSYGNKVLKSRMHELLSDPFYMGKIRWNGQTYPGDHEPIITRAIFDEVQQKLVRQYKNPQYKKHLPVFKSKITCEECGGTITWEIQKGHWYGHCNHYKNCSQKVYVRQEIIEEQIFPLFDKVSPKSDRVTELLEKAIARKHEGSTKRNEDLRADLQLSHDRIQRRIEKMYEDKLDGKITADFYDKKCREYTADQENLLSDLEKLGNDDRKYFEVGYAIHELAEHAVEIYNSIKATTDDKRLLLAYIFSDLGLNADKIRHKYTYGFEFLAEWSPLLNKNFEPTKNPSKNGVNGVPNHRLPEPMHLSVNNNFEPKEVLILGHDSGVEPINHDLCSRIKTFANF
ncbi:MAG: hypothetical protein A3D44_02910 [Candidatus Staskawiczbacteria bacterium RIFCSPHIGHO2_02_FULL_42_22]|uniref:Recombinase domain-containing protein n=1 Tax=Candidatus Staskawiczbacteria bacterium RIFCSPHIGHO2_02_FULL_42_22 TaxID=1802207 RepID=A0A1G2HZ60_9BACT|nr:MAG: hypothetical protein A3D44_02910 [Candidatus Staskawiczbacteria bacterium RIFCSPHIGHO2_02_FULL_42_22]